MASTAAATPPVAERKGQWVAARVTNWKLTAEEAEVMPNFDPFEARELLRELPEFKRVKVREEPAVTDRATMAAHLDAFGSPKVRGYYQSWRSSITAINREFNELGWNATEDFPKVPSTTRLRDVRHPNEVAARQALADAIAEELGHR